tara:strand:- start:53178 stop:53621 length:444 start_codon:yes stop_codon:yes gene_type:complete
MNKFFDIFNPARLIIVCCVILFSHATTADIAIVVNPNSSESSISTSHAKKVFLGKKTAFTSGNTATAVDQPEGSDLRNTFYQKLSNKNEAQMKAYWSRMIFSGKATPPHIVADDTAVKAWLASQSDGIGYIDSSAVDESVKVLLMIK